MNDVKPRHDFHSPESFLFLSYHSRGWRHKCATVMQAVTCAFGEGVSWCRLQCPRWSQGWQDKDGSWVEADFPSSDISCGIPRSLTIVHLNLDFWVIIKVCQSRKIKHVLFYNVLAWLKSAIYLYKGYMSHHLNHSPDMPSSTRHSRYLIIF
jgi:hypothetical protein